MEIAPIPSLSMTDNRNNKKVRKLGIILIVCCDITFAGRNYCISQYSLTIFRYYNSILVPVELLGVDSIVVSLLVLSSIGNDYKAEMVSSA